MNWLHLILCVLVAATGCKTIATTTIKTTGAIATTTLKVSGVVAKTAINTTFGIAGAAFKKGAVTVIDTTTGVSKKVPWEKGLDVAQVQTANRAVEVIRGAQKISATTKTLLKPGDVIKLR